MNKLISVIVPIYNVEKYFHKCIDSILNQTYKNLEIILIDDGSPDNCPKMCDELAQKDNRIKVIHKQNGGLMAAWIDGVKISTGNFICFIDSDDWVEPEYIEKLYEPFIKYENLDLSICNYYRSNETEKIKMFATKDKITGILKDEPLNNYKLYNLSRIRQYRWNKLYKRQTIIDALQYCDTRVNLWEDVCVSSYAILTAKQIFICDGHYYNYYDNPKSIVNTYKSNMLKNFEYFYDKFELLLKDLNFLTANNASPFLVLILYICLKNIVLCNEKNKKQLYQQLKHSWLKEKLKYVKINKLNGPKKIFYLTYKLNMFWLMKTIILLWNKRK